MLLNNLSPNIAANWDEMHQYSPAPRHRRKIILKLLSSLSFSDCLDAGCAQGYLLQTITQQKNIKGYGCDLSSQVIEENKKRYPDCEFAVLNIEENTWPHQQQFDLVISSEVIEHIDHWQHAIANLTTMSRRYLLITVPSGKRRAIDIKVGHYRHFKGAELVKEIEQHGFICRAILKQGFPVHSLYKRLINLILPNQIYASFSGEKKYSIFQKSISTLLYYLFYLNYFFNRGEQLFILAERTATTGTSLE